MMCYSNEIWKDIKGYEGKYQISNCGRLKSLIPYRGQREHLRKPSLAGAGYYYVTLAPQNECRYIHRLVAETFIPNPDNLPEVNHKDEDKRNNHLENLEWCSHLYNIRYGKTREKIGKSQIESGVRPIKQIDINGITIAVYRNASHAGQVTGIDSSAIVKVAKGRPKFITAGGYVWRFANANDLFAKEQDTLFK